MKKLIQTKQNSQSDKFNRQLSHLQSVVGLANWQFSQANSEQIKAYEQKGRQRLAEDNARIVRGIMYRVRFGVFAPIANTLKQIVQHRRDRKDIRKLLELDDHMLKDIGISRADAMALAKNKVSSDEVNARRFGQEDTKQVKINCAHQSSHIDVRRFGANDPSYLQESA